MNYYSRLPVNCTAFACMQMPIILSRTPTGEGRRLQMSISSRRTKVCTLVSVGVCSAILGPLLDNYHSQFGILAYNNPIQLHLAFRGFSANLITAPFTSPLFVVAGLIIAQGTLIINQTFIDSRFPLVSVSGPKAMTTIAAFSSIYYLSALIPISEYGSITGPFLALLAVAQWYFLDRSIGGLIMGLLTGLCGPLFEVVLINVLEWYSYATPEMFGIPLFIAPVYFAGGPAVGNLARAIEGHLRGKEENWRS